MSDESTVTMELRDGFEFDVDLGDGCSVAVDEPPPLGRGRGPNASRLLAAAVGNCLSASALMCLRKARIEVRAMQTTVRMTMVRNAEGRLRIGTIHVDIEPVVATEDQARMARCLDLFEDFCVVTESVRGGIDVQVEVSPIDEGARDAAPV